MRFTRGPESLCENIRDEVSEATWGINSHFFDVWIQLLVQVPNAVALNQEHGPWRIG